MQIISKIVLTIKRVNPIFKSPFGPKVFKMGGCEVNGIIFNLKIILFASVPPKELILLYKNVLKEMEVTGMENG